MHTATALQDSDRCLIRADDADDSSLSLDQENDCDGDDLDQLLHAWSGLSLRIKTAGLRKGKHHPVPASINLVGTGVCQALNDRTALLMHRIVGFLSLDKEIKRERAHGDHHYCVYSATSSFQPSIFAARVSPISYTITIYRNAEPQQLKAWAQEEYDLYSRILEGGVSSATPVLCLEHIMVTRNITSGAPYYDPVAPLKSYSYWWTMWPCAKYLEHSYVTVLWFVRQLYQRVGIVQGSISEHTVLFRSSSYGWGKCWLTDFSHAINRQHPDHGKVLAQDLARINAYFVNQGQSPGTRKQWIGLLPDGVAMAYVTKEDLGQGFDRYDVRKLYHEELGKGIPFLQKPIANFLADFAESE